MSVLRLSYSEPFHLPKKRSLLTESKSRNLVSLHIRVTLRVEWHVALDAGDGMRKEKQGPHNRVPPPQVLPPTLSSPCFY